MEEIENQQVGGDPKSTNATINGHGPNDAVGMPSVCRRCQNLRQSEKTIQRFWFSCGTDEIRKKVIIGILSEIANKESLCRVILILQSEINFDDKKMLDDFPIKLETFQITELLFNISKHVLAPKHELSTTEEKRQLLRTYNVKDTQLPRILESDAIARYYGLEKGQLLKVIYNGAQTDSVVTYRCVV